MKYTTSMVKAQTLALMLHVFFQESLCTRTASLLVPTKVVSTRSGTSSTTTCCAFLPADNHHTSRRLQHFSNVSPPPPTSIPLVKPKKGPYSPSRLLLLSSSTRSDIPNDTETNGIGDNDHDDNNDNDDDNNDMEEEEPTMSLLESVTDEEALLACRDYLQRKHKLEWTQHERRRRLSRDSLIHSSTLSPYLEQKANKTKANNSKGNNSKGNNNSNSHAGSAAVGYFWEDPSELIYLRQGTSSLLEDMDEQSTTSDSLLELAQEANTNEILNIKQNNDEENHGRHWYCNPSHSIWVFLA